MGKNFSERLSDTKNLYFNTGMEAGYQKCVDILFVCLHQLGWCKSKEKAMKLFKKMMEIESEYGHAWQGNYDSDDAIRQIDNVLKQVFEDNYQPFFERNIYIKDWWLKKK